MHPLVVEETIDDLLRETFSVILRDGSPVTTTRGPSRELVGASLELLDPRSRLSRTESRRRSRTGIAELCWYLSGTTDPSMITHWVPNYEKEIETAGPAAGTIRGAYGPRMFGSGRDAQFDTVQRLLADNPTSRRAVIQLFDATDLTGQRFKDVPCTTTIQFLCRDEQLHVIVTMRSNDAYVGLPLDVFTFTMLQELMAGELGVGVGRYIHTVGSLHIYEDTEQQIEEYLGEGWQSTDSPMPSMPAGSMSEHVPRFTTAGEHLVAGHRYEALVLPEDAYWADLVRMLALKSARERDPEEARAITAAIEAQYFREFIKRG